MRCAIVFRCLASVQHSSTQLNTAGLLHPVFAQFAASGPRKICEICEISGFCETIAAQCSAVHPANSARPELPVRHFRHPPFQGLPHVRDWPGPRLGIFAVRFQPGFAQSTKPTPKARQKSPKAWTSGTPLIAQPPNVSGDRPSGPPTTTHNAPRRGHAQHRTCTGCTPPLRHAPPGTPVRLGRPLSLVAIARHPLTPAQQPLRHASSASTAHPLGLPAPPAEDAHPGDPRWNSCCLFSLSACSAERRFRGLCT